MWTAEQRARHKVRVPKERKGYPTDVSDQEWKLIEPLLPGAARIGCPRRTELRQVINALRYLVRSGCEWRMLPNDFPPYQTVYYWFRRLVRRFLFRTIHGLALMLDRMCEQRVVVPSAGIVDSQSGKAPSARERGYDAHKKISGRKRHIAVDRQPAHAQKDKLESAYDRARYLDERRAMMQRRADHIDQVAVDACRAA